MNAPLRASSGLLVNAHLATLTDTGNAYGAIENGALAWRGGQLVFVGRQADLPDSLLAEFPAPIDAAGAWITPALIDCHTHLVLAGNRAEEAERPGARADS